MKNIFKIAFSFFCFVFTVSVAFAQPNSMIARYSGSTQVSENDFLITVGTAFYNGDINYDPIFGKLRYRIMEPDKYELSKQNGGSSAGLILGAGYRFKMQSYSPWAFVGSVHYIRLRTEDLWAKRNLGFYSDNFQFAFKVQREFNNGGSTFASRYSRRGGVTVKPFVSLGLSLLYFNPKAEVAGMSKSLAPLNTEGKDYFRTTLAIPFEGGLRFNTPAGSFALAIAYNFAFSDYLDDASRKYYTINKNDQVQATFADRSTGNEPYNQQRANPERGDGFLTFTLTYGFGGF